MAQQHLVFHAVVDAFGGHGRVGLELARQMLLRNVRPEWHPTGFHWGDKGIPTHIRECILPKQNLDRAGFTWIYAQSKEVTKHECVRYLVTESENVPREDVKFWNTHSRALCCPSHWNRNVFLKCGVTVPVYVLPHGVAPEFSYAPVRQDKLIFATVGEFRNNPGFRKNPYKIIEAFQKAFPSLFDGSVELWIKTQPGTVVKNFNDLRVKVCAEHFSQSDLVTWIKQTSIYVNGSRAEGWCMGLHESMACGRPYISTMWGGPTEFLSPESGWEMGYTLRKQKAGDFYDGQVQAEPNFDDMVEIMRHVYANPLEVAERGLAAHKRAHQFSWNSAGSKMYQICKENGLLLSNN